MTIRITCDCGKALQLRDDCAGKRVRCPICHSALTIPAAAGAPAAKSAQIVRSKTRPAPAADGPAPPPLPKVRAVRRRRSVAGPRRVHWLWIATGGVAALAVVLVVGGFAVRRLWRPGARPEANPAEAASSVDRRPQNEPRRQEPAEPPLPTADRPPAKSAPAAKPQPTPPTKPTPPPLADPSAAKPAPPPKANRPPAKAAPAEKPPAAPLKTAAQVRALLAKEVRFAGSQKALVTLRDVLDTFTKQFGVKFVVDEAAFRDDGVANVLQQDLSADSTLAPMNTQFDLILRKVLQRIPNPSGVVFAVGPGTIQITVASAQAKRWAEPPPRPTAAMARRARDLKARLAKRVDFQGLNDPRATLSDVLVVLARKYELFFDINERAFRFDQLRNVDRMAVCETQAIPAMKNVPLSKVLETILARIPAPSKAGYRVTPQGYIEISTKLFIKVGE